MECKHGKGKCFVTYVARMGKYSSLGENYLKVKLIVTKRLNCMVKEL